MAEYYRQRPKIVDDYLPELPSELPRSPVDAAPFTREGMLDFLSKVGNVASVPLSYATSQVYTGDTKTARESEASKNFLDQLRSIENPFNEDSVVSGVRKLGEGLTKAGKAVEKSMPTSDTYLRQLEKNPDTYQQYKTGGLSFLGTGLADAYKNSGETGKAVIAGGSDLIFDPMNHDIISPLLGIGSTRAMREAQKALELGKAEALARGMSEAEFNNLKQVFSDVADQKLKREAAEKTGQWNKTNTDDFYHSKNIAQINKFDLGINKIKEFLQNTPISKIVENPEDFKMFKAIVDNNKQYEDLAHLANKTDEQLKEFLKSHLLTDGDLRTIPDARIFNINSIAPEGFKRLGGGSFQTAYQIEDMPDKVLKRYHSQLNSPVGSNKEIAPSKVFSDQGLFTALQEKELAPKTSTYLTNDSTTQIQDKLKSVYDSPEFNKPEYSHLPKYTKKGLFDQEFIDKQLTPKLKEALSPNYEGNVYLTDLRTANVGYNKNNVLMPLDLNVNTSNRINNNELLEKLLNDIKISKDKDIFDAVYSTGKNITPNNKFAKKHFVPTIDQLRDIFYNKNTTFPPKFENPGSYAIHDILNSNDFEKMVKTETGIPIEKNRFGYSNAIDELASGKTPTVWVQVPETGTPYLDWSDELIYNAYKEMGIDNIPVRYVKVRK